MYYKCFICAAFPQQRQQYQHQGPSITYHDVVVSGNVRGSVSSVKDSFNRKETTNVRCSGGAQCAGNIDKHGSGAVFGANKKWFFKLDRGYSLKFNN